MSLNVRRSVRGELHLSGVSTVSTNTMNMASFDNGHYHHMSYVRNLILMLPKAYH
jgi:hypothetical protein